MTGVQTCALPIWCFQQAPEKVSCAVRGDGLANSHCGSRGSEPAGRSVSVADKSRNLHNDEFIKDVNH